MPKQGLVIVTDAGDVPFFRSAMKPDSSEVSEITLEMMNGRFLQGDTVYSLGAAYRGFRGETGLLRLNNVNIGAVTKSLANRSENTFLFQIGGFMQSVKFFTFAQPKTAEDEEFPASFVLVSQAFVEYS